LFLHQTQQETLQQIAQLEKTLKFIEHDLTLVEKLKNNILPPTRAQLGKRSYNQAELVQYSNNIRRTKRRMLESNLSTLQENYNETHAKYNGSAALQEFSNNFTKFTSYTVLSQQKSFALSASPSSEHLISSIDFDKDDIMFAAACNQTIKLFKYVSVLQSSESVPQPAAELHSTARVASVSFNSQYNTMIAGGTNAGTVKVWNTRNSAVVNSWHEHEKRVYSVDFSHTCPTLLASGSDDGMAKFWSLNQKDSVLSLVTPSNVCCVRFHPTREQVAVGSADHLVYIYDLRLTKSPLMELKQHTKAVSHLCFRNEDELVSSSVDGTINLWDLSQSESKDTCVRTFRGHVNEKNFVGLSCTGEYISVGGEDNTVVTYHKQFSSPAVRYCFRNSTGPGNPFVSSICWKRKRNALVAANSNGEIRLLKLA